MRIGVDARELTGKPTGVGRYLSGLLNRWIAPDHRARHEFVLYAHRPLELAPKNAIVRELPGAGGTLWEQRTLAGAIEADQVDVLFSPAYSTPLFTDVPRVVALHDISFAARPDWYSRREGMRRRLLAKRGAAAARRIVTISEFSKSEIVSRFRIDPARIAVIPPGIDAPAGERDGDGPEPGHDDRASVLYVGSIFNRRHIPELIAAFTRVATGRRDAALHLVGDNRSFPHQDVERLIASSAAASRIHWHHYVTDRELRSLYRQARAFAFLSEYEGLGLTPLEALAAGVPSLLLDTPVARESCGDAALYTSLGEPQVTARDLERVIYDEPLRRSLLTAAPATLARYDWERAAAQTLAVLESAP